MATYTYTIYDANPNECGDCAWPSHEGLTIEADDDDDAIEDVRDAIEVAAAGLSDADGYAAGDKLYANVWDADGMCVGTPSYTLTEEDLS